MGEFQENPCLRIGRGGLPLADAEVRGVESGRIVEKRAPPGVGPAPGGPPRGGYGGDGVVAVTSRAQKASGVSAPGKRQAMETTATAPRTV